MIDKNQLKQELTIMGIRDIAISYVKFKDHNFFLIIFKNLSIHLSIFEEDRYNMLIFRDSLSVDSEDGQGRTAYLFSIRETIKNFDNYKSSIDD